MESQTQLGKVVSRSVDPMRLMMRVVEQALVLIKEAEGATIGLVDEDHYFNFVCAAGSLADHVGLKMKVEGSLSGIAFESGEIIHTDNAPLDPRADKEVVRKLNIGSSLYVPLSHGQRKIGVLNVASSRPYVFGDADALVLGDLAEFVGIVVGAAIELDRVTRELFNEDGRRRNSCLSGPFGNSTASRVEDKFVAGVLDPRLADRLASKEHIEQVMAAGTMTIVFQPIVDLDTGSIFGYEALSRFSDTPLRAPDLWFGEAHKAGLGIELELAALELAMSYQTQLPAGSVLAVNVGPDAIASPRILELLESANSENIVFELTEHAEVDDYPHLIRALDDLRAAGARLAIDDTGSGISSLAHIIRLSPEFIKLDRTLTAGIDHDPARRALASSLVSFASEIGPLIVAEGIETPGELQVLRSLGILYGQGYYLGMPGPLP